ncbi:DivIVA domain-containing protein [bacterium]|nr:DivIVA domain-containing protein [bacterium]
MLSPIEIKKQEFGRAMRGYDTSEVRSFLETVADELEKLSEDVRSKTIEIEALKAELTIYQRIDQNMKDALVNAQETLRGAKVDGKREAELVLKEAELEAERIITEAQKKGRQIQQDLETISDRRNSFIRKLKTLLRSELELIQLLEGEDLSIDGKSSLSPKNK